jgi:hypothetical protein
LEKRSQHDNISLGTLDVMERISILLADYPELIDGFNVYLPPGYRVEPGGEYPPTSVRLHTNTMRSAITLYLPKDEKSLYESLCLPFATNSTFPPSTPPAHTLEVVEELHKAINAFEENDEAMGPTILAKPLDELLEDSGYSIITRSPEEEFPALTSAILEPFPGPTSSLANYTPTETLSRKPVDQRTADTPTSGGVNGASPHQDQTTNTPLPVTGQTVLYSVEHLVGLEPLQRITLSERLHNRYKQLRPLFASPAQNGPTSPNDADSPSPAADTAATPTRLSSTVTSVNSAEAKEELREIKSQITRLIDLNIAADCLEMMRGKNAPPPQPSPLPEDSHNSNSTNNADERPDPTLPQNRPTTTTTTTTTISTPSPPYSFLATRDTTRIRSLPYPPRLPPPSTLPPTFPQLKTVPAATPPAISPPPRSRLQHLALLDEVEREDKERGGRGRLSFDEFEEIMKGERGKKLGFVGAWIEMASF